MAAWYLWRAVDLARERRLPRCACAAGRGSKIETSAHTGTDATAQAGAAQCCCNKSVDQGKSVKISGQFNHRHGSAPVLALYLLLVACVAQPTLRHAGETGATGHYMVVVANPLAAAAGRDVIEAGGTAADAAVAVQAVLGLVEPQSSGLGGGAFITYYDAARHQVSIYDGRETAPAGATPDMFIDDAGKPLSYAAAVLSGRSTGTPGAVAALGLLQHEQGHLPWRQLFDRAQQLATDGFVVSPRMARFIAGHFPQNSAPDVIRYFTKEDGTLYAAGDVMRNPAYTATLQRLATRGPSALYHGSIAEDIVHRVHEGARPGSLSLADLDAYRPLKSDALCRDWQQYRVCAPPPPAGGVSVLQGLLLLGDTDIASRGPDDPIAWVEMAEAERLLYADRDRYVADPAKVAVPTSGLLDPTYIKQRSSMIGEHIAAEAPAAGNPPGATLPAADHTLEPGGTSHFVIVDRQGNVVSMTTTVESIYGSGRMVDGFFLNNQLTDFSFSPLDAAQRPAANAVAPGKRPRSAMAPTIVLDKQAHFVASVGSAGGPAIISYILKSLIATLDWHLSMQAAINLPNLVARGNRFSADISRFDPALLPQLEAHGLHLAPGSYEESGLQGVLVRSDGTLEGAADPRREGVALGR